MTSPLGEELDEFVESLHEELNELVESDDQEEDDHRRYHLIEFPYEAVCIHGINYLQIPIRDVLTLAAEKLPEDREALIELRDDFYSGDQLEDYATRLISDRYLDSTPETRAEMRFKRSQKKPAREAARAELQLDVDEELANEEKIAEIDHQYDAAKAIRDRELEEYWERSDKLSAAWDQFYRDRRDRANDPSFDIKKVREDLREEQHQLFIRSIEIQEEYDRRLQEISYRKLSSE